jgi:hypothetical protein
MGADHATWRVGDGAVDGTTIYSGLIGEIPYWFNAQRKMERQATPVAGGGDILRTKQNWEGYLNQVTKQYYEETGRENLKYALPELVAGGESGESLPHAEVITYLTQASHDFVTGKLDLATQWDAYLATLNEKGIDQILQAVQAAYNREVLA